MASRYQLRSITSIAETVMQREQYEAADVPSDNEENHEEPWTDLESEEDADDDTFEPPNEAEFREKSENESTERESAPTARKRERLSSRGGETSRCGRRPSIVRGKDGHRWYTTARERVQSRQNPVNNYLPGPIGAARNVRSPLEAWGLLFQNSLLEKVVLHTNEEIHRYRESIETEVISDMAYSDVDLCELKAFIGLLYFSGMQKTSNTNAIDLWSYEFGSMLYRSTMTLRRFQFLTRMIRFDDKTTRAERRETDKFAPIRELWQDFISKCTKYYTPASYCTIDEQLLLFRGRCPFKVYNSAKLDKYGMKIVMLNDSRTFYMYTAEPYVGTVDKENSESVPSYYVRKLSEPLHGSLRNITCDNWFSSVEIFDKTLQEHSLTMVGTLRKNKRQIPEDFIKAGPVHSSKFGFDGTKTLVRYVPKKNKIVLLLSSFNHTAEIDQDTNKPAIITFYKDTKGGTVCFDQMCHEYTTARKTLWWPLRFWLGMLDQGGINAMILHNFNGANKILLRRDFLKALIKGLIEPQLRVRLAIRNLRRDLRLSIESILQVKPAPAARPAREKKLARCAFCPRSLDRKVKTYCERCNRPACEEHRAIMCSTCSSCE